MVWDFSFKIKSASINICRRFFNCRWMRIAIIGLQKGSGKWLKQKVSEKSGNFEMDIEWQPCYLCLPPVRVGRHIVFPGASVRLSVCLSVRLSVTNPVCSITWKPLKLYSGNFIHISISMRWLAECKNGNSAFYTFWVISLWTLCFTKTVSAL